MTPAPQYHTRKTLSAALQISISTIKRHEAQGLLPRIRIGRLVRYAPDAIDKLFLAQSQQSAAESKAAQMNNSDATKDKPVQARPPVPPASSKQRRIRDIEPE